MEPAREPALPAGQDLGDVGNAEGRGRRRRDLVTIGLLQYLTPTVQFLLGLLWFHEPMPTVRWVGFVLVWIALAVFTGEAVVNHRGRQLGLWVDGSPAY